MAAVVHNLGFAAALCFSSCFATISPWHHTIFFVTALWEFSLCSLSEFLSSEAAWAPKALSLLAPVNIKQTNKQVHLLSLDGGYPTIEVRIVEQMQGRFLDPQVSHPVPRAHACFAC